MDEDVLRFLLDKGMKINKAIAIASIPNIKNYSESSFLILAMLPTDATGRRILSTILGQTPASFTGGDQTLADIGAPVGGMTDIMELGEWLASDEGSVWADGVIDEQIAVEQYNNKLIMDAYNDLTSQYKADINELVKMKKNDAITELEYQTYLSQYNEYYASQGMGDISTFTANKWAEYENQSPFDWSGGKALPFKQSIADTIVGQYPESITELNERLTPGEAVAGQVYRGGEPSTMDMYRQGIEEGLMLEPVEPEEEPGGAPVPREFQMSTRDQAGLRSAYDIYKAGTPGGEAYDIYARNRPAGRSYNEEQWLQNAFNQIYQEYLRQPKKSFQEFAMPQLEAAKGAYEQEGVGLAFRGDTQDTFAQFLKKYPFLQKYQGVPAYQRGERQASFAPRTRRL